MHTTNSTTAGQLLTCREVADRLGVCERTIANRIRTGELRACKLGRHRNSPVRIDPQDLAAYLAHSKGAEAGGLDA